MSGWCATRRIIRRFSTRSAPEDGCRARRADPGQEGIRPHRRLRRAIVSWLDERDEEALLPPTLHLSLERADVLRYGENPDQPAASYRRIGIPGSPDDAEDWWNTVMQHSGVALSYLNLLDAGAGWALVHDLGDQPAAAIIKHAGPCGAAVGADPASAYRRALACDERAAFGGVVALNRPVDLETVGLMEGGPQADVVIAPGSATGWWISFRARRAGTRILEAPTPRPAARTVRRIEGGWLVQGASPESPDRSSWRVVSRRDPGHLMEDAAFAWRVAAHVASNAAVLARNGTAWGIGGGSRTGWARSRSRSARRPDAPRAGCAPRTASSRSQTG